MELINHIKEFQSIVTNLKKLANSRKPLSNNQRIVFLQNLINKSKSLGMVDFITLLENEYSETKTQLNKSLENRRETLLSAAKSAGIFYKRYGEYDRIIFFKVSYKGMKVKLEIGSELVREFEETEGIKVLQKIQEQIDLMENKPFVREMFFETMKDAIRLAQEKKKYRDGWIPIQTVYLYFGLLRNLQFEEYSNNPSSKSYQNYSKAQFVYELARFGQMGWSQGKEKLTSMPPNMATVTAGKSMILPDLENPGSLGTHMASIRID